MLQSLKRGDSGLERDDLDFQRIALDLESVDDVVPFQPKVSGGYLTFLGRISPEKRPDHAIEIAARTGMPLKIAAKVDRTDQLYWQEKIRPIVEAHANVEFIGEIAEHEKRRFLGQAAALLFPIDWPEPFGLVMIEAMACGTPVIVFKSGSVVEVIEAGVSGFVVETLDEAVAAVGRIGTLERAQVRAAFERRFTVERMTRELRIYQALCCSIIVAAQSRRRRSSRLPCERARFRCRNCPKLVPMRRPCSRPCTR